MSSSGAFYGSGGSADDQRGFNQLQGGKGRGAVDALYGGDELFGKIVIVVINACKLRLYHAADLCVIVTDHGNVLGNVQAVLLNTVHGAYGRGVIDSDDGSGDIVQSQQIFRLAVAGFVIVSAEGFVIFGVAGDLVF